MAELTLSLNSESLLLLLNNDGYHQLNDLEDLVDDYIDKNNNESNNNQQHYLNKSFTNNNDISNNNNNNELSYNKGFEYCNNKQSIWGGSDNTNIYHEFYPTAQIYNNNELFNDIDENENTEEDYERYVPDYLDQNEIIDDTIVEQQQQQQLQFNLDEIINLQLDKNLNNNNNSSSNDQATKLIKNIENAKTLWDQPKVLFNRALSMQCDDEFESPYFTQDESDQIEDYLIEMSNKMN